MPNSDKITEIMQSSGIEDKRPLFAWTCLEEVQEANLKEYAGHVKKLPAYIQTNGLGQTLGFIFSKAEKDEAYKLLLEHMRQYLKFRGLVPESVSENKSFIKTIITQHPFDYFQITGEVMALLQWLRRFAEGRSGGDHD